MAYHKAYLIGSDKEQDKTRRAVTEQATQVKMVTVISSSKICKRCMIFCMELKPSFKFGKAAEYFRKTGKLPVCKVFCKNGCHERFRDWGWVDISDPYFRGKHIPAK